MPRRRGSPRRSFPTHRRRKDAKKIHSGSPRQRMSGWNNKKRFLSPSLAYFPKLINTCILDLIRGSFFSGEHPP